MEPPRLVRIRGEAFASFVNGFELELPETGLVLLRGENLDTKGSSASGKSTLIHALNYGHGTCPVPLTELQSWYTKDTPKIVETYDFGGKVVEVARGKKFEMTIDGEPFRGSAGQKEEKVDQLFGGMDAEMRLALTYRAQGEPGLFMSKTDSKKKEFLTKLLGLEEWEEENRKAAAQVTSLETKVATAEARLVDAQARIAALRAQGDGAEVEASLIAVQADVAAHETLQRNYETTANQMRRDAEVVAAAAFELFKPEIEKAQSALEALETVQFAADPEPSPELVRLQKLQEVAEQRLSRLEDEDNEKAKALVAVAQALLKEWQALALRAAGTHRLLADRDRVAANVKVLQNNVCPTCSREWDEVTQKLEELKDELQQINGELEELRDIQETANALKKEYDAMPTEIEANPLISKMEEALDKIKHDVDVELVRLRGAKMADYEAHHAKVNAASKVVSEVRDRAYTASAIERSRVLAGIEGLETLARQEKDKKIRLELARQKLAQEVGAYRERGRQIAELERGLAELDSQVTTYRTMLASEKDFAHLTGREGFRGSVFDEALEAISAETNDVLASIANTRNCTLEFESERETQDGKMRQEITPVLTINGHKNGRPSGGMRSTIELAVDLAVGKIISERTGVCPGWLILDETFDGLGPIEKETCIEILSRFAHERLIVVVDHMSETAGLFTKTITVSCEDGRSRLVETVS